MDLETFLKWEKSMLREERARLSKLSEDNNKNENVCPVELLLQKEKSQLAVNCNQFKLNESKTSTKNALSSNTVADQILSVNSSNKNCNEFNENTLKSTTTIKSSMTTALPNATNDEDSAKQMPVGLSNETFLLYAHAEPEQDNENAAEIITKSTKNLTNHQTASLTNNMETTSSTQSNMRRKLKNKDDMEQWVTDTFYSYFPGFNDELQKRQRYLRERQQENQQNFIKHQLTHPPLSKNAIHRAKRYDLTDQAVNTARSFSTTTSATTNTNSSTMSHPTDKTDLEIIVNNPGYVPPKQHTPRTTRNKLLQDLRHIELSNIIGGDGVTERNRNSAELESARKKDYQRELMEQIEEKRRSVEILREKERRQDEVLTKRLQEQLKTIQLEEQLEKEKMRADKARFDSEQSRLMREHLIAKLENDTKLLYGKSQSREHEIKPHSHDILSHRSMKAPGTATTADVAAVGDAADNNNKVYKYFSNSARHEYRRGKPLPEELELDLNIGSFRDTRKDEELECFHLSEKVCPMCDAPLKSYESCCLRCQKKLSIRMHARYKSSKDEDEKASGGENLTSPIQLSKHNEFDDIVVVPPDTESYSMVCEKCERLYGLCPTCLAQNEVCKACHRKRNVCMNCRRMLCTRCLDEIAKGRDTERSHINETEDAKNLSSFNKNDVDSERSFQVLEVNYAVDADGNKSEPPNDFISPTRNVINFNDDNPNNNNSMENLQRPPYSMSIERNSIFHFDFDPVNKVASFEKLDSSPSDENFNIERIRKETDNRLSRYLRNYGDLAVNPRARSRSESGQDRSTQTTPNTAARRDVVMHEEHNLSMPLLREMPRMTRSESNRLQLRKPSHAISNRIEQLKRRWEIPAVQKFTISTTSPKVLTQVGAIRKQLQDEHLRQDILNENV